MILTRHQHRSQSFVGFLMMMSVLVPREVRACFFWCWCVRLWWWCFLGLWCIAHSISWLTALVFVSRATSLLAGVSILISFEKDLVSRHRGPVGKNILLVLISVQIAWGPVSSFSRRQVSAEVLNPPLVAYQWPRNLKDILVRVSMRPPQQAVEDLDAKLAPIQNWATVSQAQWPVTNSMLE